MSRIIPAYAGQIQSHIHLFSLLQDHPRIRGTNDTIWTPQPKQAGSSPHTRDKFQVSKNGTKLKRIIPAYAGQIWKFIYDRLEI